MDVTIDMTINMTMNECLLNVHWNVETSELMMLYYYVSEIKIISLSKRSTILHWHGASCPSLWMSLCHNGARQGTLICWLKSRGQAWSEGTVDTTQHSCQVSAHRTASPISWPVYLQFLQWKNLNLQKWVILVVHQTSQMGVVQWQYWWYRHSSHLSFVL